MCNKVTLYIPNADVISPYYNSKAPNLNPAKFDYYRFAIIDYLNATYPHVEAWPTFDWEFKEISINVIEDLTIIFDSLGSEEADVLLRLQLG